MINQYTKPEKNQASQVVGEESNIPDLGRFHEGGRVFHPRYESFPDDAGVRGLCKHLGIPIGDVY